MPTLKLLHIYTRKSKWEEDNKYISEKVRDMSLKKYKNLIIYGIWSTKEPKDAQITALVGV